MEKKFDIRSILIAALLFFAFVFLIFYKYSDAESSADAWEYFLDHPEVNVADLVANETAYNLYKDYAFQTRGVVLPEWGDAASPSTQVQDYFRNVASGFIGQYAFPDQSTLTSIVGAWEDLEDLLSYLTFDSEDGDIFVRSNDRASFIGEIDRHIYTTPPGETIGNFYPLPIVAPNGDALYNMVASGTTESSQIWAAMGGSSLVLCSLQSSNAKAWKANGDIQNYPVAGNYVGTLRNGFYRTQASNTYLSAVMSFLQSGGYVYESASDALDDFFGSEFESGDPVLTGAIIVNDDPSFTTMSLPSSVTYDYTTKIVEKYVDDDDTPIPNNVYNFQPYVTTYDVPQWLVDTDIDPISFELPSDYDFGNIDFDYEPDHSILAGAGLVQDVFEVLPSDLTKLIAFFGIGSLAFMFFKR